MRKPLALDLCCGRGGWAKGLIAAGWDVWGFDTEEKFREVYPGRFHQTDVRLILCDDDWLLKIRRAELVVASPPCPEFTRHMLPWTKKRNPPPPDLSIWKDCELIAREIVAPIILENVREAQNWVRKADWHFGPYYLWGSIPALMPKFSWSHYRKKETRSSTAAAERAEIPFELALHIGRVFLPEREGIAA